MNKLCTMIFFSSLAISQIVNAAGLDSRVASLKKQLKLSDQQTAELDKVYKETRERVRTIKQEIRDIEKEKQLRMEAMLTPEQAKLYEDSKKPKENAEVTPEAMMLPMGIQPQELMKNK